MDVNGGARMATLGVRVEQTGVESAKAEVVSYGAVAEQSASKVSQAFQQTAQSVRQSASSFTVAEQQARALAAAGITMDQMIEAVNGNFSALKESTKGAAAGIGQVTDSSRALTLAQMEAIDANTLFDGKFVESRTVLAAHTEALSLDSAAHRQLALAQSDAIAMNAAFDGKFVESRAVVLAHAEALQMDAASNETLAASTSGVVSSVTALIAVFGAYKVGQFAADAVDLAARYQTLGVVLNVVGKNAGETNGEMATLQAGLQKTGISAIESRQNLIRLTEAHVDLSKASQLARVAQDAAVIGNINSSEAFARLTQGIQTAQVRVLRTIGINVNFEDSYKRLAKEIGTTTSALDDDQKVQARTNAVLERGIDIAGSYTAAMNTVGKELNSTKRYLEDTKVKAGEAFLPEYTVVVHEYANALKFLGDNAPAVAGAIAGVTASVVALGVAAGVTAIALAPITLPIVAAAGALALIGVDVGIFTAQAASARAETAKFADSLKGLGDDQLRANLREINQEINDLYASPSSGSKAEAQMQHLMALRTQFSDQLTANQAAETAAANKTAAATEQAETKRQQALRRTAIESAAANGAMVTQARQAYEQLSLQGEAAEHQRVANEALNKTIAAQTDFEKAKVGATADEIAQAKTLYEARVRAIDNERQWNDASATTEGIQKRQADAIKNTANAASFEREALLQLRREIVAMQKDATDWLKLYDEMTKANDNFTRSLKEDGIRAVQEIANRGLTSWTSFFDAAEHVAARFFDNYEKRIGTLKNLLEKAKTEGKDDLAAVLSSDLAQAQKIAGIVGVATAGATGFSTGLSSGSVVSGVASGAASGAFVGNSVFPGFGALVGGLAGLTGGLLGGAEDAQKRREAEDQLRKSYAASVAQIQNQLGIIDDSTLAVQQLNDQFDALRKTATDINKGSQVMFKLFGVGSDQLTPELAKLNALQQQYLAQIAEEARLKQQQYTEDLRVRLLRAQGNTSGADALELQLKQERERQDLIKSFGQTIDPTEAATLALLDQVQAQEKLAASSNNLASSFLNIDDGLRVMADRFNAITPQSPSGPAPYNPPTTPTASAGPYRSATGDDSGASTAVVLMVDGRELARGVVKNLQRKSSATLGTTIDWAKVSSN